MTMFQADEEPNRFARTLAALRIARQLSKKQLAAKMGFDPSYVSHVESGRFRPTPEFTRRAETVLAAAGQLVRAYFESHGIGPDREAWPTFRPETSIGESLNSELRIEHEQADLALNTNDFYSIVITRRLRNTGENAIIRFPVRIEVDAFPDDVMGSRLFYRNNPLNMETTGFWAEIDGRPTSWTVTRDLDAYKKINVPFKPDGAPLPLYPGQTITLRCGYRVHRGHWGPWLEREIRWPTDLLSVSLSFPFGMVSALHRCEATWAGDRHFTDEAYHLSETDGLAGRRYYRYQWSVAEPDLGKMYRFEWQLSQGAGGRNNAAA